MFIKRTIGIAILLLLFCAGGIAHQEQEDKKPQEKPSKKRIDKERILKAMDRGLNYLLKKQKKKKTPIWKLGTIRANNPFRRRFDLAYKSTISSIVALCLLSYYEDAKDGKVLSAVERYLKYLVKRLKKKRIKFRPHSLNSGDWGCAYNLSFLAKCLTHPKFAQYTEDIKKSIAYLIRRARKLQDRRGCFGYKAVAGPNASASFITAAVIHGVLDVKEAFAAAEIEIPKKTKRRMKKILKKAGKALRKRFRIKKKGWFKYTPQRRHAPMNIDGKRGSASRRTICELALFRLGKSSIKRLEKTVKVFFKCRKYLKRRLKRSKTRTHLPPYGIAPYYYYFSHYYVTLILEQLSPELQEKYYPKLIKILLKEQKKKKKKKWGYWVDSKDVCGKTYGTAMAMMILAIASRPYLTPPIKPSEEEKPSDPKEEEEK